MADDKERQGIKDSPGDRSPWQPAGLFPMGANATRGRTKEFALVLRARGIPHRVGIRGTRLVLLVPPDQRQRAEHELWQYVEENRNQPESAPQFIDNRRTTFAVLAVLGLFHDLTFQPPGRVLGIAVDWHRLGILDRSLVLQGEWWRIVTALTLHADGLHLAGNLLLGGLLIAQLNRQLGVGLGMSLVLAAGSLGNATNVLIRSTPHRSLGASTGVFAALGVLVARATWTSSRRDWRRWILPLGAGAGLIAFTGVGGERTDYLAHLLGFGWGLVAGSLTRWPRPLQKAPGKGWSIGLGLGASALLVGAWAAAIHWG